MNSLRAFNLDSRKTWVIFIYRAAICRGLNQIYELAEATTEMSVDICKNLIENVNFLEFCKTSDTPFLVHQKLAFKHMHFRFL